MGKHVKKKTGPLNRGERRSHNDWNVPADDPFAEESLLPETAPAEEIPSEEPPVLPEEVPVQETPAEELPAGTVYVPSPAEPEETPAKAPEAPRPREGRMPAALAAAPKPRSTEERRRSAPPSASRRRKKRRKKKGAFRRGLRIYTVLMLVLMVGVLVALWIFLDKHQKNVDALADAEARTLAQQTEDRVHAAAVRRAPQDAFDSWLASVSPDTWTQLWFAEHPDDVLESQEVVRDYMTRRFSAASPYRATEYTAEAPVYVLRDDAGALAKIRLSGSDTNWSVSDVELLLQGKESASVRAFTGSKVFCNGIELSRDYAGEVESQFDFEPLADQLVNPVGWVTYSVSGLLLPPDLSAEPPEGNNVTKTAEGDFLLCLDEAAGRTYVNKAVAFMRAYQFYYMSGYYNTWTNLYAALDYLVPGTTAYQTLFDTKIGVEWNTAYGDIDTSNTTAGDVVVWADNCYSVDVTYAPTGLLNGQRVNYDGAGTMRIYYLQGADGAFFISHFQPIY